MSNDIIVENTTISQLDEANSITSGDILLVSVPKENTDEFESKKLDYESLKNKLSDDFGISSILDSIAELQRDLSVEPHEISVGGEGYQILSSIGEDNRGRVNKLNSYQLSTAIDFILKNVTLSEIKAINSPWVLSSNVVSTLDENPSPEKVVSLELAKQLHQSLYNYIPLSAIAQDYNTDDGLKVISQKVAYTLVHELSNSYILQSDIIGSLEAAENWDSSEERQKVIAQIVFVQMKNRLEEGLVLSSNVVSDYSFIDAHDLCTFQFISPEEIYHLCSISYENSADISVLISSLPNYNKLSGWEKTFITSDTNSQYISTFTYQSDAGVSVWLIERLSAAPDEQDVNSTIIRFRDGTEQYINKASGELALSDLIIRGLKTDKDSWVIQPVSVTIGVNISSIGDDTFSYSTALRNITLGKNVKHIGTSAFYNIPQIRSLELPSGIRKLSDGAFSECDNLLDVNIPSSLMVCEKDVFKGCKNLNSVTLEDGLSIIGETMFDGCTSLTAVQIPHSVSSIGESAFVNHNPNIVVYFQERTINDISVLSNYSWGLDLSNLNWSKTIFQFGPEDISAFDWYGELDDQKLISAGIKRENGEWVKKPKSVTVGHGITSIGDTTFTDCTNLTSIIIPDTVTSIGEKTFFGCSGLAKDNFIIVNNSLYQYIGNSNTVIVPGEVTSIVGEAFCDNNTLKNIIIPDSVSYVGDWSFVGCTNLTSVNGNPIQNDQLIIDNKLFYFNNSTATTTTINASVSSISPYAFNGKPKLISISIPDSVIKIGEYAFENDTGLNSITLGNNITSIGDGAFKKCNNTYLKTITLPSSLVNIGNQAFLSCTYLGTVNNLSAVHNIGLSAFGNTGLAQLRLGDDITIINNGTFGYCTSLTSVTLGNNISCIDDTAFIGCSKLPNISLPSSVVDLGTASFMGATALKSITLGNSITSIGDSAFQNNGITSIEVPESVVNIGESALYNCTGLTKLILPNSLSSVGTDAFKNLNGLVSASIPQILCDKPLNDTFSNFGKLAYISVDYGVSSICNNAFTACSVVQFNISLPNTLLSIGDSAFQNTKLTSINIPDSVTDIGKAVCLGCNNLNVAVLGDGISSIKDDQFTNSANLTSITVPQCVCDKPISATFTNTGKIATITITDSAISCVAGFFTPVQNSLTRVTFGKSFNHIPEQSFNNFSKLVYVNLGNVSSVGIQAFNGCTSITEVVVPQAVCNGDKTIFEESKSKITSISVSEGVSSIAKDTFSKYTALKTVTLPDTLSSIGEYAFFECYNSNFKSIVLPSSLTSIGNGAFSGVTALTSFILPQCVCSAHISSTFPGSWNNNAYGYASKNISVHNNVTSIGDEAFRQMTSLTSISLGDGLETIGASAFLSCNNSNFKSIVLPSSLTSIGQDAFSGCNYLTSFILPQCVCSAHISSTFPGSWSTTSTKNISIHNNVTSIGDEAFRQMTYLTSISFGDGLETIGASAFVNCNNTNFKTLVLPSSLTSIGDDAFKSASYITSIQNLSVVKEMGSGAFSGLANLTGDITLNDELSTIGNDTFNSCNKISSIHFPSSLISIGERAFKQCGNQNAVANRLTSINIPNGVTNVGASAFYGCTYLANIVLPSTLTSIGDDAFTAVNSLTSFTLPQCVCTSHLSNTFPGSWSTTSTKNISVHNNVTSIGDEAFRQMTYLTSISLGENVETIGASAFVNCNNTNFKTLVLPSSLTSIGNDAFKNVSQLTNITIPQCVCNQHLTNTFPNSTSSVNTISIYDTATNIGVEAFQNCGNLSNIIIGEGVTDIYARAFQNCGKLSSITIPSEVTAIGENAFYNDSSLTVIYFPGKELSQVESMSGYDEKWGLGVEWKGVISTDNQSTLMSLFANQLFSYPDDESETEQESEGTDDSLDDNTTQDDESETEQESEQTTSISIVKYFQFEESYYPLCILNYYTEKNIRESLSRFQGLSGWNWEWKTSSITSDVTSGISAIYLFNSPSLELSIYPGVGEEGPTFEFYSDRNEPVSGYLSVIGHTEIQYPKIRGWKTWYLSVDDNTISVYHPLVNGTNDLLSVGETSVYVEHFPAELNPKMVASQLLVQKLSNDIKDQYVSKSQLDETLSNYVLSSNVVSNLGDSTYQIPSQKAITDAVTKISSFEEVEFDAEFEERGVVFLSRDGMRIKPLLNNTIYVCENQSDINNSPSSEGTQIYGMDGKISSYYKDEGDEIKLSTDTNQDNMQNLKNLGIGLFVRNPSTQKTYYVTESEFLKFGTVWN